MHGAEEAATRALYQALMDGWNEGSGASFAAPFAEDTDLIGFDGTHLKGRDEIASFHQTLFDKWLRGTRLTDEVDSVRFLTADAALMHAVGGIVMAGNRSSLWNGIPSRRWSPAKRTTYGAWPRFRIRGCAP